MSKKHTIEFVKKEFKKENYTLLEDNYINSTTRMKYKCPNNHIHFIRWGDWQQGIKCPYCSGCAKHTIEFIKSEFEKENYKLLTKIYKNAKQKLKYVCQNGHEHSISWNNWKRGFRCPYCSNKIKKTIGFIKQRFKEKDCILLTTEYINSKQKLDYICPNGHRHKISWNNFQKGIGCLYCSDKMKKDIEFIRLEFDKCGYKLLSSVYEGAFKKLYYICANGHKTSIRWNTFQQGGRCSECWRKEYGIKYSGKDSPSWKGGISCEPYCFEWSSKEFKDFIKERDGYQCLNPDCFGNIYRLDVHHIDYNKKNCDPQNLITLCRSCNSRANKDREWHESWYKAILNKRYEI